MIQELLDLKSEMLTLDIVPHSYGIDELPREEGVCIFDARSVVEVFYYEHGQKMRLKTFTEVTEAIGYFKEQVTATLDNV